MDAFVQVLTAFCNSLCFIRYKCSLLYLCNEHATNGVCLVFRAIDNMSYTTGHQTSLAFDLNCYLWNLEAILTVLKEYIFFEICRLRLYKKHVFIFIQNNTHITFTLLFEMCTKFSSEFFCALEYLLINIAYLTFLRYFCISFWMYKSSIRQKCIIQTQT